MRLFPTLPLLLLLPLASLADEPRVPPTMPPLGQESPAPGPAAKGAPAPKPAPKPAAPGLSMQVREMKLVDGELHFTADVLVPDANGRMMTVATLSSRFSDVATITSPLAPFGAVVDTKKAFEALKGLDLQYTNGAGGGSIRFQVK